MPRSPFSSPESAASYASPAPFPLRAEGNRVTFVFKQVLQPPIINIEHKNKKNRRMKASEILTIYKCGGEPLLPTLSLSLSHIQLSSLRHKCTQAFPPKRQLHAYFYTQLQWINYDLGSWQNLMLIHDWSFTLFTYWYTHEHAASFKTTIFILLPSLLSTLERLIFLSFVFIITKHQKVAVSQILRKVKERPSTF